MAEGTYSGIPKSHASGTDRNRGLHAFVDDIRGEGACNSRQRRTDIEAVGAWEQNDTMDAASYDRSLAYFRDRYYENDQFTHFFDGLHLRANDHPALVRSVLDGTENGERNRLVAVLIIVLRYRNNLFQGVKWQYQLENFRHANSVLKRVLEQHGNLAAL